MVKIRLSLNSTLYYAWSHLSVLGGIMLAVAVLVGALLVGDSIKYTLSQTALLRLGGAHYALDTKERYFRADLADRLQTRTSVAMAPALMFRGVALGPSERQVNNIQILGVDQRFRRLAGSPEAGLPDDGIAINTKLAKDLGVKQGDLISIRFSKPSLLPHDAPLASRKGDDTVRGTFTVVAIWGEDHSGRFSLSANQLVPCNAFVSLRSLQVLAGLPEKANLVLAGESLSESAAVRQASPSPGRQPPASGGRGLPSRVSGDELESALKTVWSLEDLGLIWRDSPDRTVLQLGSDRIMLDPALGRMASEMRGAAGTLTYLVNSISAGEGSIVRVTPYSFVMAMDPVPGLGPLPVGMNDDEILVNRWLADQLSLSPGEPVKVTYYEFTAWGRFLETNRVFRVSGIAEMDRVRPERDLAPLFPGLTDVGRCADWDIGMPLDEKKMEDPANEAYWEEYRDTPKAFVTLKAGQAMWANRFGSLTAIRFKTKGLDRAAIEAKLRQRLEPADVGFRFVPVRQEALKAVAEAMDFGQLFLGMSSFLIVAALMLTALLFSFSIQQRSRETGLLLAVGFTPARVRWLLVREGIWVAGVGSVLGAGLGVFYTRTLIRALNYPWKGAVASTPVHFHAEPATIVVGVGAGVVMAIMTLVLATWRQAGHPARELLAGDCEEGGSGVGMESASGTGIVLPCLGLVGATVLVVTGVFRPGSNPAGLFFMAGSLLLVSLLGLIRLYLVRLAQGRGRFTLSALGIRNIGRRRTRSLTVIGLLAVGCFMVFAVSSMQENVEKGSVLRTSGTGGFALFGESSLPILADLTSPAGWRTLRLDQEPALRGVEILPIKVRDGDDASCLNLNRAQAPRLLGIDPVAFEKRGAFGAPWSLLRAELPDGCVPGFIGDANTAQWGLQKKVGEVLLFRDEKGATMKVRVVGVLPVRVSVFQGTVLIPANRFSLSYPSESGIRMFLADVPAGAQEARAVLARRLGKFGLDVSRTVDRLKEFHVVESTYLTMFLVLGGLGLLLGSGGVAIVVMRAIRERKSEFALLKAVGYSDEQVRTIIAGEHRLMLGLGVVVGVVASLAALWPALKEPGIDLPVGLMVMLLAGIVLFLWLWIEVSIRWAFHDTLLSALRNQ